MVVFEVDYDEIKLQNIVMTSFQKRHHHYVTEKRHQSNVTKIFPIWASPNQISGCASGPNQISGFVNNLIVFKKAVLVLKKWSCLGLGLEKIGGLGLVTYSLATSLIKVLVKCTEHF